MFVLNYPFWVNFEISAKLFQKLPWSSESAN